MSTINILNTLTREHTPIIKKDLLVYACGPTVYDSSHLGHAKTYMSIDVMKRVLEHFNYRVTMVMNITNIDDKIINKARETNKDYKQIADYNEQQFFQDMDSLGIQRPDIVTRVSDYIPEIIAFIAKLINDKSAYEANGSVYFNTELYLQTHKSEFNTHKDDENETTVDPDVMKDKKNAKDFVLWKKSKPNEPFWESPFGKGRPGWHIECSTMATNVSTKLGHEGKLDIHFGGIDLAFPHHSNEIAQSCSYLGCDSWVDSFIHIGHLNIQGLKMSKSLKNFITIKQLLKDHSPNSVRMLFLNHKYNTPMNYTNKDGMSESTSLTKKFADFFAHMDNVFLNTTTNNKFTWTDTSKELNKLFTTVQTSTDTALLSDFDTQTAISNMLQLINKVFATKTEDVAPMLNKKIYDWIKTIYTMLGFTINDNSNDNDLLDTVLKIRNDIRDTAKLTKDQTLFALSDKIRDEYLQGYSIQDFQ